MLIEIINRFRATQYQKRIIDMLQIHLGQCDGYCSAQKCWIYSSHFVTLQMGSATPIALQTKNAPSKLIRIFFAKVLFIKCYNL